MSEPNPLIERIRALRISHLTCDDCWHSCPKSEEGCCDDRQEGWVEEGNDWKNDLCMDIEAPHCRDCDDWHWGPCYKNRGLDLGPYAG
jgi:hypothetical protein